MKKLIPIGNKVFLRPDSATNISDGGIILSKEKAPNTGVVVCTSGDSETILKEGDRVRYVEGAGLEENGLLLIDEQNILYIYERAEETGPDLSEGHSENL